MAEWTRFEASGDEGLRRLSAALRREALAERPAFSPALQQHVLVALDAKRRRCVPGTGPAPDRVPSGRQGARPARLIGAVGGLAAAACVAIMVMTAGPRLEPPASPAEAAVGAQGIEALPTPEEIGTSVLSEVATLAAAAVGVPDLSDLAAFDPASFMAGADPRP